MKRYDLERISRGMETWQDLVASKDGDYIEFTEAQAIVKPAAEALRQLEAEFTQLANVVKPLSASVALHNARAALAALDAFGEGE